MCRTKKACAPLERAAVCTEKNKMPGFRRQESTPGWFHAHAVPFPGDGIPFRLRHIAAVITAVP